ncbi:MAG TPA: OsmC family protein [Ohtaekwangia sp.]|uniref:OsmC family protein n=1 Tax=Ohtaekwangia sp. TaxID=2066019 RepID=UPI002F94F3A7
MKISASVKNSFNNHVVAVDTNGNSQALSIASKSSGYGSSVNGGELLLLALATCFCNDIYREATRRNILVTGVDVEVTGEFGGEGEPGTNFQYKTRVTSDAPAEVIQDLISYTDRIAEINNTLRKGLAIKLINS